MQTIFNALSSSSPQADVNYCIQRLTKRLAKTHNWTVALKTLLVIHRAFIEVDQTLYEKLIKYRGCRLMLNLSHFRDDSSQHAWEYSAWVRAYALYLEEHLECYSILKYDIQKSPARTGELKTPYLLEQLPAMQQLLFRLLGCKPEGMALHNSLIHFALAIVAGESIKLYVAITDGILNLVDKYFEMERHDAIRALDIYKKATDQGEKLSEFFEICNCIGLGRQQKFLKIDKPPASFLTSMEEYVAEAPLVLALDWKPIDDDSAASRETSTSQDVVLVDYKQVVVEKKSDQCETSSDPSESNQSEAVSKALVTDLLCLDEVTQETAELDDKNSIALAIVSSDNPLNCETSVNATSTSQNNTDWELALVRTTSSNGAADAASKPAGVLDKLTLDSLYDNAMARGMNQNSECQTGQMASNPFEDLHDNQASSNIAAITNQQTAATSQENSFLMMQKEQQQPVTGFDSTNPFQNPFVNDNLPSFVDNNMPSSFGTKNVPFHLPQNSRPTLI
ncbi:putative clathrin assembly protein At5g35200 isoform X1 [Jatropha curcas]|nr:putative clathrin assembly protein At5g35200 isoform X1 [Jatropha curcas]